MVDIQRLVQFLLARVEDDERDLKKAARQARASADVVAPVRNAISAQNPVRWREECAAKRRIIGITQQMLVLRDQPAEEPVRRAAEQVLRELAAPYAQHDSYQEHWRV